MPADTYTLPWLEQPQAPQTPLYKDNTGGHHSSLTYATSCWQEGNDYCQVRGWGQLAANPGNSHLWGSQTWRLAL